MSVVNLVILLVNVACVLVHEDWVVEGAEVHLLDAAEVPVMMVMDAGILKTYVFLFFSSACTFCFPAHIEMGDLKLVIFDTLF